MTGLLGTNGLRAATLLSDIDEMKKLAVWRKGLEIPGWDSAEYRRDAFGHAMRYSDYGNRSSDYGWELDHYPVPASLGGSDDISNLRPLYWRTNCAMSDNGGIGGLLGR